MEVIVSFAILAISLTVIVQSFSIGVRGNTISSERLDILIAAKKLMAEFGSSRPINPGRHTGKTKSNFTWVADVTPYRLRNDNFNTISYWIRLNVSGDNSSSIAKVPPVILETLKIATPNVEN